MSKHIITTTKDVFNKDGLQIGAEQLQNLVKEELFYVSNYYIETSNLKFDSNGTKIESNQDLIDDLDGFFF